MTVDYFVKTWVDQRKVYRVLKKNHLQTIADPSCRVEDGEQ
jgi:hypothetical protein